MIINHETKLIASMALKPSALGAAMHNAAYAHLGLNFVYVPFGVSDAESAVRGLRAWHFRGCSVTMPHKVTVMPHLDHIDPVAQKIGAVNTIVNNDGVLTGYNSDWIGAVSALKEQIPDLRDKRIAIIGAGGAARAVAYGLKAEGARVSIFNRTISKAQAIAEAFDLDSFGSLSDLNQGKYNLTTIDEQADGRAVLFSPGILLQDEAGNNTGRSAPHWDIIINTTSVGYLNPSAPMIIDLKIMQSKPIVMDIVAVPMMTPFLQEAITHGCMIIPGYRMLLHQAVFQFEVFTGQKAPIFILEQALKDVLQIKA